MTFSIIGTGNIAWVFGSTLVTAKHHCTGVYARDAEAAAKLAQALRSDKHGSIADVDDGVADICLLAVSDTAISEVAAKLSLKQTILVHTAGAVEIDAIRQAANERAVLWPVYSILKNNPPNHRQIPCAWEASSDKAKRLVPALAHAITDILFEATYEQRKWLHLSAVIGNNFANHLMAICEQICKEHNLPFSTLVPIIEQTFDRIKQASPTELQTGPAIRNDISTLSDQVNMLEQHPAWQTIYIAISDSIRAGFKK
jgi:predicted short-subunit dehydrogenase-like oxidoreductase (DUF2520 family)